MKILRVKGREVREFQEGTAAYIEALEAIESQRAVKPLKISAKLAKAAQDHVEDCGQTGLMSQVGSNGSLPKDRMEKYTGIDSLWTENLYFGGYKPREIVEYMLVSDGDRSRGLRKNIFNPKLCVMGVAAGPHPETGSVIVVDFVKKELAQGELPTMEIETTEEIPEELKAKMKEMGVRGKIEIK